MLAAPEQALHSVATCRYVVLPCNRLARTSHVAHDVLDCQHHSLLGSILMLMPLAELNQLQHSLGTGNDNTMYAAQ